MDGRTGATRMRCETLNDVESSLASALRILPPSASHRRRRRSKMVRSSLSYQLHRPR